MSGTLRLTKVEFAAGPRPGAERSTVIEPGTVVVLVGPNNSGKSLALREIEDRCVRGDAAGKVVASVAVDLPRDIDSVEAMARPFEVQPPPVGTTDRHFFIQQHGFRPDNPAPRFQIDREQMRSYVEMGRIDLLRDWLPAFYTVRLDGRTRFSLSDPKPMGDLLGPQTNHLGALFVDDESRERVRKLTEEAFGLHFVIDPTETRNFRIRLSQRPPAQKAEEQGWDAAARRFHGEADLIGDLSDGVQAFVGLVSAVLSLPHKIILVDEPEAFLHPPLARRLGGHLARLSREREATLIAATHSAEFLMGCLEAVRGTSVVRLQREGGVASARSLAAADLSGMATDPLLRSTDVLRSLFHRAAIVTEGDTDRAFYDEMNRRLTEVGRGIDDALFLNAQNKQTIRRLVEPLRRIGVPAAAVADLDLLEDRGTFGSLLAACGVPEARRPAMEVERAALAAAFAAAPNPADAPRAIKSQGISVLGAADLVRAKDLLTEIARYGLFLIPEGEVERWLAALRVPGSGSVWLVNLFSRLAASEGTREALPAEGDVWQFLDQIAAWAQDPNRQGID